MVRFVIIGVVIAVAFTLYALVDAAMTDARRARGVSKAVWVVLVVLLPVIGGILWFTIGKSRGSLADSAPAPDDDPRFTGTKLNRSELDAHMRELEDRLRELDDEVYPGEGAGDTRRDAPHDRKDRPGDTGAAENVDDGEGAGSAGGTGTDTTDGEASPGGGAGNGTGAR